MKIETSYWVCAVGAVALTGCTNVDGPSPPGTIGDLGNGQFLYECDLASDVACDDAAELQAIPEAVAVGSRFGASYVSLFGGGKVRVLSAAPQLLENVDSFGSIFEAQKPGTSALLAQQGDDFVDFVHVRLAEVASVRVNALDPIAEQLDTLAIAEGLTRTLRAQPLDDKGAILAGGLPCNWTVEDSAVARIATDSNDNQVVIEGVATGVTTATVQLGALEHTLEIEVGGGAGGGGGGGSGGEGGAGGQGGQGGTGGES